MGNCARIRPKPYKVCVGDMRSYITIKQKTKAATNTTNLDPNLDLTDVDSMWAMQQSVNGEELFDGVNMIGKVTDEFYIRYNPATRINKTMIIEFDSNYYNVEDVKPNLQGRREFTLIKTSIRGDSSLENTKL